MLRCSSNGLINKLSCVAAAFLIAGTLASGSIAAQPQSPAPAQGQGDLSRWEQRLLGQPYEDDPIDKRIQRLELLLYGSTQDGSFSQRLDQIRATIASRPTAKPSQASTAANLSILEQKILKHTFPAEKPELRLSRLEQKVFGKASPAMPASDRIDRLKKTLGIGEPPPIAQFPGDQAFMRQFDGSIVIPFGEQSMDGNELNRQMSDVFRQLNQQLRQLPMRQLPMQGRGASPNMVPYQMPNMPNVNIRPFKAIPDSGSGDDAKLPPYLDPNSI
jgi:hypothetical protein